MWSDEGLAGLCKYAGVLFWVLAIVVLFVGNPNGWYVALSLFAFGLILIMLFVFYQRLGALEKSFHRDKFDRSDEES